VYVLSSHLTGRVIDPLGHEATLAERGTVTSR